MLPIPWLLALALVADGWYLRCDIIWEKKNPMPESVTDRPTKAHEYLFLLTRSAKYYYDADAIRDDITSESSIARNRSTPRHVMTTANTDRHDGGRTFACLTELGHNKRSVWTIATEPFPAAHFATYPTALVEPCIKAGARTRGLSGVWRTVGAGGRTCSEWHSLRNSGGIGPDRLPDVPR